MLGPVGYTATATLDTNSFTARTQELPVHRGGCWSHARRYFVKVEDGEDKRARRPLAIIGELFVVEKEAKDVP